MRVHHLLLATILATPAAAATTDILIGLDSKVAYGVQGQQNVAPGADAVLVMDISKPAQPRIRASLPLANSLLGPPTNLQITPDGKLGLVANSVTNVQDGAAWKSVPDDKLHVIDLTANPPRLLDTVTVGKQPSGLMISRNGKLLLIANRAGRSVSVLTIDGTSVKLVADVPMDNEVAGVAITPDGKRAFAVLNVVNKVAVLAIDGGKVTYDKALDIPVAFNPYNIDVAPDGRHVFVSATGAGGSNGDALVTIDTAGAHPHVTGLATAGRGAEGFAVTPDGRFALTPLLLGSGDKQTDWSFTRNGEAVLLSIAANGALAVAGRLPLGGLPEGVAFSGDSRFAYVGNYIDQTVQVFRIGGGRLTGTGVTLKLPGQPASLRGVAR
ncbi:MAG: YncE family protein [Janthinobacterium lividum]